MQTSGLGSTYDAAVEDAVNSNQREFVIEVKADWLRNGSFTGHAFSDLSTLISKVSVDRALSGSAPSEIMLVEGASAAEMTLELGGDYTHPSGKVFPLTAVFSPYNGLSPLYQIDPIGAEVTYRLGIETVLGTVWYPQFVGNVRTITPDRRSNTVEISVLDRAEKMRQPVSLPVWAVNAWQWNRGYREAQTVKSTWVIDQALKTANISTSPYRPPTPQELAYLSSKPLVQFWLSGNGGALPNIGVVDNARVQGYPKPEVGGAIMYTRFGEAHPLVKSEVEASGKRPYTLSPTTTDATGIVPGQISQSPWTSDTDANRSYHLAYRVARAQDLYDDKNGTHWMGFLLPTRGYSNWWQTTSGTIALEAYCGYGLTLRIRIQAGTARAEFYDWTSDVVRGSTPYTTIPTGQDAVLIEAQFAGPASGSPKAGIRCGANFGTYTTFGSLSPDSGEDAREGIINVNHQVAMQDIYWSNLFAATANPNDADFQALGRRLAKYAAVMDEGKNLLTRMPDTSYEDGWELVAEVASAEFGSVFWDENGVFRFWNRDTMVALQDTIVKTVTLDEAEDLGITNSSDSVRNIVTIDAAVSTQDQALLFESMDSEQFYIPANDTTILNISDSTIAAVQPGIMRRYALHTNSFGIPLWNPDTVQHGYTVEWYKSGSWVEDESMVDGVDVFSYSDGRGNLVLRVHNGYTYPARFPKLRVAGTKVNDESNTTTTFRDETSVNRYNPRNWTVSGDWIQAQPSTVQKLGAFLLDRTVKPIPATDSIAVAGDPRLQLGDCIEVQDPGGFGESIQLQVLGITRTYDASAGLVDELMVEMIEPSLIGLWDSETYGLWDISFIWSD